MDVHCSTCKEPWDTYHLQHDLIHEILPRHEAVHWLTLSPKSRLHPHYRDKFKQNGWEFGSSVLTVIRCPSCPKDLPTDKETVEIKTALEDLLGDDEDGLASTFEDYGL